jgi:hypothetical protein
VRGQAGPVDDAGMVQRHPGVIDEDTAGGWLTVRVFATEGQGTGRAMQRDGLVARHKSVADTTELVQNRPRRRGRRWSRRQRHGRERTRSSAACRTVATGRHRVMGGAAALESNQVPDLGQEAVQVLFVDLGERTVANVPGEERQGKTGAVDDREGEDDPLEVLARPGVVAGPSL